METSDASGEDAPIWPDKSPPSVDSDLLDTMTLLAERVQHMPPRDQARLFAGYLHATRWLRTPDERLDAMIKSGLSWLSKTTLIDVSSFIEEQTGD